MRLLKKAPPLELASHAQNAGELVEAYQEQLRNIENGSATDFVDDLPDRQISEQPNLVTGQGFALIESALTAFADAAPERQPDAA